MKICRIIYFVILFTFISTKLFAQKIDSIKALPEVYIWGESIAKSKEVADQNALAELVSQISTTVSSEFSLLKKETSGKRRRNYKEVYNSVINSYSHATLINANRIVVPQNGSFKVFRYIKRDQIKQVFRDRERKIREYINNANNYLNENKISDALRYYYWALILLQSHPYGENLTIENKYGNQQSIASWLPVQINMIFDGLSFKFIKNQRYYDRKLVTLLIKYNGKPVSNLEYRYVNSRKWSKYCFSKNGIVELEMEGPAADDDVVHLKIIYAHKDTYSDKELNELIANIPEINFPKSFFNIEDSTKIDREKVQAIADQVGAKLMNCCSSFGSENLFTTVHWGFDNRGQLGTRYNDTKDKLIIYMTVQWNGAISGARYSITGRLIVDLKTGHKQWVKEEDHGMFPPNCGGNCDIN